MLLPKTLSLFVLVLLVSCKTRQTTKTTTETNKVATEVIYDFSKEQILQYVKELSSDKYEGRETGTRGAVKAKNYIVNVFKKMGVHPLGSKFEQSFPMPKNEHIEYGENVIGWIKGSEKPNEYIVISAHYDHEGIKNNQIYNGADDDASGIAALFAFAEYFQKHPPKHSVILAAFDAEEKGLVGSYFFVKNPIINKNQLKLTINMDMISRSDQNELYAVGPQHYPHLKPYVEKVQKVGNVELKIGHKEWTYMSDHAGFHQANIPFVYFGVEDHKDYHQPTDDFENIHPTFYVNSIQTIISFFKKIDQ